MMPIQYIGAKNRVQLNSIDIHKNLLEFYNKISKVFLNNIKKFKVIYVII